jgi:hypothetical protein
MPQYSWPRPQRERCPTERPPSAGKNLDTQDVFRRKHANMSGHHAASGANNCSLPLTATRRVGSSSASAFPIFCTGSAQGGLHESRIYDTASWRRIGPPSVEALSGNRSDRRTRPPSAETSSKTLHWTENMILATQPVSAFGPFGCSLRSCVPVDVVPTSEITFGKHSHNRSFTFRMSHRGIFVVSGGVVDSMRVRSSQNGCPTRLHFVCLYFRQKVLSTHSFHRNTPRTQCAQWCQSTNAHS